MSEGKPLTEEEAISIMKERGYIHVSIIDSTRKGRIVCFSKISKDSKLVLHADVELNSESVELSFGELKFCCYLASGKFDFYHKDFSKYEQSIEIYAALCVGENVFEIMDSFTEKQEEKKPKEELKQSIPVRKKEFWLKIADYGKEKGYTKEMCMAFYNYWVQMNEGGKKLKFEIEKSKSGVFDIAGRLRTWKANESKFSSIKNWEEKRADKQNEEKSKVTTADTKKLF